MACSNAAMSACRSAADRSGRGFIRTMCDVISSWRALLLFGVVVPALVRRPLIARDHRSAVTRLAPPGSITSRRTGRFVAPWLPFALRLCTPGAWRPLRLPVRLAGLTTPRLVAARSAGGGLAGLRPRPIALRLTRRRSAGLVLPRPIAARRPGRWPAGFVLPRPVTAGRTRRWAAGLVLPRPIAARRPGRRPAGFVLPRSVTAGRTRRWAAGLVLPRPITARRSGRRPAGLVLPWPIAAWRSGQRAAGLVLPRPIAAWRSGRRAARFVLPWPISPRWTRRWPARLVLPGPIACRWTGGPPRAGWFVTPGPRVARRLELLPLALFLLEPVAGIPMGAARPPVASTLLAANRRLLRLTLGFR